MIEKCLEILKQEFDNPVLQTNLEVKSHWDWFIGFLLDFYHLFNPDAPTLKQEKIGFFQGSQFHAQFLEPINEYYIKHDSSFIVK